MPHACLIYYSKQKLPQKQDLGIQRDGMKAELLFSLSKIHIFENGVLSLSLFSLIKCPIFHICVLFSPQSPL